MTLLHEESALVPILDHFVTLLPTAAIDRPWPDDRDATEETSPRVVR